MGIDVVFRVPMTIAFSTFAASAALCYQEGEWPRIGEINDQKLELLACANASIVAVLRMLQLVLRSRSGFWCVIKC